MSDAAPRRPIPYPDDASAPFWEAAAQHRLVLQRCSACGEIRHPPRPMCPRCRSMETEFVDADGTGRVWSWVVAHPPVLPAFAAGAPFNVVVVELDEGVRMIGNMPETPNDEIHEGMRVAVTFQDVEEGVALPQWKPI